MKQKEPLKTKICVACEKEKSIDSFNTNKTNGYTSRRCKICVKNKNYKVEDEVGETKECKVCKEIKPVKQFNKAYGMDGFASRCKLCVKNKMLIPKELKEQPGRKELVMELYATSKQDYVDTYKFIETMGYNLNDDIHIQFCKKYGLTPRSPKKKFLNHYTQKDCGLV
jgi:hypothetical protein